MNHPPALECAALTLRLGTTRALDGLDLEVHAGETMALLGPSGSGKSTLLGAVAGFAPLDDGTIRIGGEQMDEGRPPERRPVSMVFQNYALWPHMTAREIVAYPLRRAGVTAADSGSEAERLLDRVGIGELADRYPSELSGGQQQRVGLARALAKSPTLYLFDEPTAHLDAALRATLQEELIDRQRETGAAAVYASHDPREALAVADRVALLRAGKVVQTGTPRTVYETPVDAWSAQLTGPAAVLQMELLDRRPGVLTVRIGEKDVAIGGDGADATGRITAVVRPEWVEFGGRLDGVVHRVRYLGSSTMILLDTEVGRVWVRGTAESDLMPGDRVRWTLNRVWVVAL